MRLSLAKLGIQYVKNLPIEGRHALPEKERRGKEEDKKKRRLKRCFMQCMCVLEVIQLINVSSQMSEGCDSSLQTEIACPITPPEWQGIAE